MKYFKNSSDISEELANVLIHNKYLLDDLEALKCVIFARVLPVAGKAFEEGCKKESIPVNDLSQLALNTPKGFN